MCESSMCPTVSAEQTLDGQPARDAFGRLLIRVQGTEVPDEHAVEGRPDHEREVVLDAETYIRGAAALCEQRGESDLATELGQFAVRLSQERDPDATGPLGEGTQPIVLAVDPEQSQIQFTAPAGAPASVS